MCCLVCKTVGVHGLVGKVFIARGTCQPEGDSRSSLTLLLRVKIAPFPSDLSVSVRLPSIAPSGAAEGPFLSVELAFSGFGDILSSSRTSNACSLPLALRCGLDHLR